MILIVIPDGTSGIASPIRQTAHGYYRDPKVRWNEHGLIEGQNLLATMCNSKALRGITALHQSIFGAIADAFVSDSSC